MGSGTFPAARRAPRAALLAALALLVVAGRCPRAEPAPEASGNAAVVTLYAVQGDARRLIGTGFFVAPGVLVTAYHVARAGAFSGRAEEPVRIDAVLAGGTALVVRGVRGGSPEHDVVALTVGDKGNSVPTIPIRESPVVVGELLVTVGSPRGRPQTVSSGRAITTGLKGTPGWEDKFEASIPSFGGASGCPVLDTEGRAVGVAVRGGGGPQGTTMATAARFALPLLSAAETPWAEWRLAEVLSPPERAWKHLDQASISWDEGGPSAVAHALDLYQQAALLSNRERALEDALDGQCKCLVRLGSRDEALQVLRSYVRRRPRCGWAERLLGSYLHQSGDAAGAVTHLEKACEMCPGDPQTLLDLEACCSRLGRAAQSLSALREAVAAAPAWAYAWERLGWTALTHGYPTEAADAYRRLIELRPDYATAYGGYAQALLALGRADEAREAAEAAIFVNPDSAEGHVALVYVLGTARDDEGALREMQEVRRLDPGRATGVRAWLASFGVR